MIVYAIAEDIYLTFNRPKVEVNEKDTICGGKYEM